MSVYNSEQLVSVHVYDKALFSGCYYVPKSWLNKTPYFSNGMGSKITAEEVINNGGLIENNIVYEKPEVRLYFSNGQKLTETFNTLEEALIYKDEVVEKYIKPENRIHG